MQQSSSPITFSQIQSVRDDVDARLSVLRKMKSSIDDEIFRLGVVANSTDSLSRLYHELSLESSPVSDRRFLSLFDGSSLFSQDCRLAFEIVRDFLLNEHSSTVL